MCDIERALLQLGRIQNIASAKPDAISQQTILKLAADADRALQEGKEKEPVEKEPVKTTETTSRDYGWCRVDTTEDSRKVTFKGKTGIAVGVAAGVALAGAALFLATRWSR